MTLKRNSSLNLWTIVVEVERGSTLVRQVRASSLEHALDEFNACTKKEAIELKIPSASEAKYNNETEYYDPPEKIENTVNVWCTSFLQKDALVLINIILTSEHSV